MNLSVFPLPVAGESVTGYFCRLAKENGFDHPKRLFKAVFNRQAYKYERIRKEDLCRMTNHDMALMENLWLTFEDAYYIFKSVVLPKNHILEEHRWCPDCWRNDYILKCVWQVGWMPICDVHETLLLDHCSSCGHKIKYIEHVAMCESCGELVEHMECTSAPSEVLASQRRSFAAVWEPKDVRHYTRNPVVALVSQLLHNEEADRRSSRSDRRSAPREHFWLSVAETIDRYERVLSERVVS